MREKGKVRKGYERARVEGRVGGEESRLISTSKVKVAMHSRCFRGAFPPVDFRAVC